MKQPEYGLDISGLTVDFGNFVLDNVTLRVPRGCITGLIGRNGAGKTTLIRTLMRLNDACGGRILYDGLYFPEHEEEVLKKIACVFDSPVYAKNVKPNQILKYYKHAYPGFDEAKYNALMQRFSLPHDLKFSKFSFGMNKKYCLILALCQGADILILDEPTAGVDPFDRAAVIELIQEFMQNENNTVLFSTHITEDLDRIADYIAMLDCGKLRFMEEKEELLNSYRLVQVAEVTEEIRRTAIGIKGTAFGSTYLCKAENVPQGATAKIPSVEELFVYLIEDEERGGTAGLSATQNAGSDIFGI